MDKIILNRVEHTNETPNEDLLKSLIGELNVSMSPRVKTQFELRIDNYLQDKTIVEVRVT